MDNGTDTRPVFGHRDPDEKGYFGVYGGRFVPETLVEPVESLERAYMAARQDPSFVAALSALLSQYVGRPTPVWEAKRLASDVGGARLFLKREDLAHTGAHKINNALGQALLAVRMGKTRIVAETGAGQHGVATATACALLGLQCVVYMGTEDMRRQAVNVFRMNLLGASVTAVDAGSRTLKDAINEAMRDWVSNVDDTYYLLGSVLGPHPYPLMVREFQSVIGREAREQFVELTGGMPDVVVACVGGGSNALGIFHGFVDDAAVRLVGVEAGGEALTPGLHAARFATGTVGVLQGTRSFVLQDSHGNIERHTRFLPVSTTRRSDPSTRGSTIWVEQSTATCRIRRRSRRSRDSVGWKGFCQRWSRPTLSHTHASSPESSSRSRQCSSICRVVVTRTSRRYGDRRPKSGRSDVQNRRHIRAAPC